MASVLFLSSHCLFSESIWKNLFFIYRNQVQGSLGSVVFSFSAIANDEGALERGGGERRVLIYLWEFEEGFVTWNQKMLVSYRKL